MSVHVCAVPLSLRCQVVCDGSFLPNGIASAVKRTLDRDVAEEAARPVNTAS